MPKVISFEKFTTLHAAGVSEREIQAVHHAPQFHSASENFVQTVKHRASHGTKSGY